MTRSIRLPALILACLLAVSACAPAPQPLPTPTPPPTAPFALPGWEDASARTLCVQVVQTYGNAAPPETPPIQEAVETVVRGLGLQVVEDGCDATLGFQLSGTALSAGYQGLGICYTGANYTGGVLLRLAGRDRWTENFRGAEPPLNTIVSTGGRAPRCPTADEAPFASAWTEETVRILHQIWGPRALVQAFALGNHSNYVDIELRALGMDALPFYLEGLASPVEAVRWQSAFKVAALDDASAAVPLLIADLRSAGEVEDSYLVQALEAITDQDFGEDVGRWEAWWWSNHPAAGS